ncbi:MAG TPA: DUF748 domain-containing protein [Cyclobacteriaceae bacterium]|nr:DUF748 domain-containing protein [Cyclobacteriaceae bacterium]
MRPFRRRLITAALIVIVSAAVLLLAGGLVLSNILTKKVEEKLKASNASIGSLSINLFARSIRIRDLEYQGVKVNDIRASGIRIIKLLRDKRLSIRKINIDNGSVLIQKDLKLSDSTASDSIPITGIDIDRLSINNIGVQVAKDTTIEYSATVGFVFNHLALDSMMAWRKPSAYTFKNLESFVKDLKIENWDDLYALKIKEASFDKELMRLRIDSLELLPRVSKNDWGKKVKSQITRTTVLVGNILAEGVNMAVHLDDTTVMVSSVEIHGPSLHAYKDKRFPFTRKEKFLLPMDAFRKMDIGIEADTLRIHDGTITYEEFPVEGFHPAHITFEGLEATMSSVNNRQLNNIEYSTLEASAHVMKTGEVKATFKLPMEKDKKYSAKGSITNVPLRELNPLLKDVVFIEISSGRLNKMNFSFTYDDLASQGELQMDYEDLKILSLRKDKEGEISAFKTLLVNTAVKNDETLTGNIAVARNQKKAVFNLWTMSLVDGIKNALMPRAVAKNAKKKNKN